jgi:hypothetical protein
MKIMFLYRLVMFPKGKMMIQHAYDYDRGYITLHVEIHDGSVMNFS